MEAWLTQSGRPRAWIWAYGAQAFVVAIATDLAEVVGGALALYLLFGVPLWLGSLIVGVLSVLLLHALRRRGEHVFELAVGGVLAIVVVGFVGALAFAPPSWPRTIEGLVPFVPDQKAWLHHWQLATPRLSSACPVSLTALERRLSLNRCGRWSRDC